MFKLGFKLALLVPYTRLQLLRLKSSFQWRRSGLIFYFCYLKLISWRNIFYLQFFTLFWSSRFNKIDNVIGRFDLEKLCRHPNLFYNSFTAEVLVWQITNLSLVEIQTNTFIWVSKGDACTKFDQKHCNRFWEKPILFVYVPLNFGLPKYSKFMQQGCVILLSNG